MLIFWNVHKSRNDNTYKSKCKIDDNYDANYFWQKKHTTFYQYHVKGSLCNVFWHLWFNFFIMVYNHASTSTFQPSHLSIPPSRPVLLSPLPTPAVVWQNITDKSCFGYFKSEKYALLVTFRPLRSIRGGKLWTLKLTSVFHHLPCVSPKQLCALTHLVCTREAGTS